MRMQPKQSCGIVLLFLLITCLTVGCGDKKESSQAPVVSKKISVQNKTLPPKSAEVKSTNVSKEIGNKATDGHLSSVDSRIYDPKQRLNPFTPVFGNKTNNSLDTQSKKRKKRIPQTPLERIGLDQLKLVAIIRASTGNRALVEDTVGKGYIIKNGTYIGLNSGMVTQIDADSVIVEEELENLKGEMVLQSTEIKLQKPAGE